MVDLSNVIMEDGMTAKQRNALKTNKFALVYKDDNKRIPIIQFFKDFLKT